MKLRKITAALAAGALMLQAAMLGASAKDIQAGILHFYDRDFSVAGMSNVVLGEDPGKYPGWDAIFVYGRDVEETSKIIGQNSAVWKNVNKVTASFYIEDPDGTAFAEDIGFIQIAAVMGEGANPAWQWYTDSVNLLQQHEVFSFGPDCVMTAEWNIDEIMSKHGTDAENGGILKLSLQIGNDGIDDYNLKIVWTDASVEGNEDAIAEAVSKVNNNSAVADEAEAVEETVAAEAPAAGDTTVAAASEKASADTGIEGVAAVTGLLVISAGAVIILRKKSK